MKAVMAGWLPDPMEPEWSTENTTSDTHPRIHKKRIRIIWRVERCKIKKNYIQ